MPARTGAARRRANEKGAAPVGAGASASGLAGLRVNPQMDPLVDP